MMPLNDRVAGGIRSPFRVAAGWWRIFFYSARVFFLHHSRHLFSGLMEPALLRVRKAGRLFQGLSEGNASLGNASPSICCPGIWYLSAVFKSKLPGAEAIGRHNHFLCFFITLSGGIYRGVAMTPLMLVLQRQRKTYLQKLWVFLCS